MLTKVEKSPMKVSLSKDAVIKAAMKLADQGGIEALSMRKLGKVLGVEAMALYYHFANKSQLIEGMIDYVHGEIDLPLKEKNWIIYMRIRAQSAFEVLARHPWAAGLMEAGINPGPSTLNDSENMIKCFRESGFSIKKTVHAVTVINIYVYGAAQQYAHIQFDTSEDAALLSEDIKNQFPIDAYPYLGELMTKYMMNKKYSVIEEFNFGLALIIDGISRIKIS